VSEDLKSLIASLEIVLRRRQKTLAALLAIPVAALLVHLGVDKWLGAEMSAELQTLIVTLLVGLVVHQVPNKELVR
jgi:hypothetical protein